MASSSSSSSSSSSTSYYSCLLAFVVVVAVLFQGSQAQLNSDFYNTTCPNVSNIILNILLQAKGFDIRILASLTRLHFHDCFANGCDASILLEGTANLTSEKFVSPNLSLRGFEVIDYIKYTVENACPGVVSCADILAIAAEVSVFLAGGPSWRALLGRRDGLTTNVTAAGNLPSPHDSFSVLLSKFAAVGLNETDFVTLSGAHTFGRGQCQSFTDRVYFFNGTGLPDPTLNSSYLLLLEANCPDTGNTTSLFDLDHTTPDIFDNAYYTNLLTRWGLFQSDQELYSAPGAATASLVTAYSGNQSLFFQSFASSMINMGNISPLTGTAGEIRRDCRWVNAS